MTTTLPTATSNHSQPATALSTASVSEQMPNCVHRAQYRANSKTIRYIQNSHPTVYFIYDFTAEQNE